MSSTTVLTPSESVRDDLVDRVAGDPDLTKAERETTVTFADDQDRARVHSASPGVVRRILAHDDTRLLSATIHDGEGVRTVSGGEVVDEDGDIVSIRSTLPVGCILVKAIARKNNQSAAVVSEGVFDE